MFCYKDNFEEIEPVGNGAFSTVFASRSLSDDKIYAIKKVPFNHETKVETLKEIIFLNLLNSEFVVLYTKSWIENNYYIGTTNDQLDQKNLLFEESLQMLLHIQMEMCSMTLRKFINSLNYEEKNSVTLNQYCSSCNIFEKLLKCIKYMHEQKVIHRDLKPENIMISVKDGVEIVKLADFGLSAFHFNVETHSKNVGTSRYRAPEQMDTNYDTKADIYSLGIIIKELFNFGINSDDIDVNEKIINQYSYLKNTCEKCVDFKKKNRPTCDFILGNKKLWFHTNDQNIKVNKLVKFYLVLFYLVSSIFD